ncbi:hypothetical protein TNCT_15241 [Trichonephila clavata]|uniref:Uncharacterized protein n=1 Tax=Trichonephila clavata TaxID=2740835 RepID=A0A8X6IBU9_TRICU|nr:hypothetical protein TNCT_15241 [Trichonephila clavata]
MRNGRSGQKTVLFKKPRDAIPAVKDYLVPRKRSVRNSCNQERKKTQGDKELSVDWRHKKVSGYRSPLLSVFYENKFMPLDSFHEDKNKDV